MDGCREYFGKNRFVIEINLLFTPPGDLPMERAKELPEQFLKSASAVPLINLCHERIQVP